MQLINAPGKLVLPFAASGAKNAIPVASQIGIVAGAASLTDGFPPLTRTPLAAGGVPPSGLDMNGIIYELSAILRWANAGAGYVYDGTFAADSNVGGYPKGARVLRSDGLGYWFNTTDNNTTDPEGAGAVAAGWVPDFTNGVASVTMSGSNVTLTALQYGKPIIVISGPLTANLNLIFPSIAGEWSVINNTTGAYSVTCKTAAGTGVVVNSAQALVGDGTNIYSAVNDAISLLAENVASAGGTADALTATFSPAPRAWPAGVPFFIRAAAANATATPTITFNSGVLTAKTIVKGANATLVAGDIAGAGYWLMLQYDVTLDKVVLLNPAKGVYGTTQATTVGEYRALKISATGTNASVTVTAAEIVLEDSANSYVTARALSATINTATTGANGLDAGSVAANTWYAVFAIAKADGTKAALASLSATAPTLPSGYTFAARVGWFRTDGTGNKYPLAFAQNGPRAKWLPTAGSNVTTPRQMASGTAGTGDYSNITAAAAVAVANFAPSTATEALVRLALDNSTGSAAAAESTAYQGSAGSYWPISINSEAGVGVALPAALPILGANIYWFSGAAGSLLFSEGWVDNI